MFEAGNLVSIRAYIVGGASARTSGDLMSMTSKLSRRYKWIDAAGLNDATRHSPKGFGGRGQHADQQSGS